MPRKVISFSIPFMGIDSLNIRGKLIILVKTYFPFCKIQVMFNSGSRCMHALLGINQPLCNAHWYVLLDPLCQK